MELCLGFLDAPFNSSLSIPLEISGASSLKMMPDIVSVYDMQENKMKVKLYSNIHSTKMGAVVKVWLKSLISTFTWR